MFGVLIAEIGLFCRDAPINAKAIIKDTDATICLWMVKLVTLVLKNSCFRKNSKTMCETTRDKELLTKLTIDN